MSVSYFPFIGSRIYGLCLLLMLLLFHHFGFKPTFVIATTKDRFWQTSKNVFYLRLQIFHALQNIMVSKACGSSDQSSCSHCTGHGSGLAPWSPLRAQFVPAQRPWPPIPCLSRLIFNNIQIPQIFHQSYYKYKEVISKALIECLISY